MGFPLGWTALEPSEMPSSRREQMKTGRYRVRKGFRGIAILQYEYDSPSFIGGQVDACVRQLNWVDVEFDRLDKPRALLGSSHQAMRLPQIIDADAPHFHTTAVQFPDDPKYYRARPLDGPGGLRERLRVAWLVFTGKCDALRWHRQ
jgi:hypothetical protein